MAGSPAGCARVLAVNVPGLPAFALPAGTAHGLPPVATLSNPAGIHNQEWGGHIYPCTGPTMPWAQLGPLLRHYD